MNKIASRARAVRVMAQKIAVGESPTALDERIKNTEIARSHDPTKGTNPAASYTGVYPKDEQTTPRKVMGNMYHGIHGKYENMPSGARRELLGRHNPDFTAPEFRSAWDRSQPMPGKTPQARAASNAHAKFKDMLFSSSPGRSMERGIENALQMVPEHQRKHIEALPGDDTLNGPVRVTDELARRAAVLRRFIPSSLMGAGIPAGK